MARPSNIWLIGMMGSGKTSVAMSLAERLGLTPIDTDELIADRMGCSVGELWGRRGEQAFRDLEAAEVARLADRTGMVVATGGGTVLRADNVAAMRGSGLVVWLSAPATVLAGRVGNGTGRPLLADQDPLRQLRALATQRERAYSAAAHEVVNVGDKDVDQVVDEVAELWNAS